MLVKRSRGATWFSWCDVKWQLQQITPSAVAPKGRTADVALYRLLFPPPNCTCFHYCCVGTLLPGLCRRGDRLLVSIQPEWLWIQCDTFKDPGRTFELILFHNYRFERRICLCLHWSEHSWMSALSQSLTDQSEREYLKGTLAEKKKKTTGALLRAVDHNKLFVQTLLMSKKLKVVIFFRGSALKMKCIHPNK